MSDKDIIAAAIAAFERAESAEDTNRTDFKEDIKFARLSKQWPDGVEKQRIHEQRPMLTINKVAPVIRQVVNDARLNRPAMTVRPMDSNSDPDTAELITGLIRNIEQSSDADIAYDTAIDNAVSGGFGYFRINLDYANDIDPAAGLDTLGPEAFEKDIKLERIVNPLSVYADPDSTSATSSDWNVCLITEDMKRKDFEKKYPDASLAGFHGDESSRGDWISEETVRVAEYWVRERTEKLIVLVAFPDDETQILALEDYKKREAEIARLGGQPVGAPRPIPSHKVTQYLLTAAEVLETNDWPGTFIPIVPVYGDEVFCDGKRYFRSIIRDAKDANRMFNYWRTTTTELIALAPKAPYLVEDGAIVDEDKWATSNTISHPYLEYGRGTTPPQRQPFPPVPSGAMQEAMNAADDIKSITGIYDASLGARSNETSGRAISARQREGDVSSFHFIDNLTRAIRHAGRIILDLIPKVYSTPRIIRVLGDDGKVEAKSINQPMMDKDDEGREISRIYDLRLGRYDLSVTAGPSFSTRREETATQMIEFIRSYPDAAPIIGDLLAKNLDWPGAEEIAKRLEKILPPQVRDEQGGGIPLEIQQQMQQMQQVIQQMGQQLQQAQQDRQGEQAKLEIDARKVSIDEYKAETDRMQAMQPAMGPEAVQALVISTLRDILGADLPQGEGLTGPTAFAEPDELAA